MIRGFEEVSKSNKKQKGAIRLPVKSTMNSAGIDIFTPVSLDIPPQTKVEFYTDVKAKPALYVKRRRNNRVLEKFYDAKYVDVRTGEKASGMQLGCQRTNRREPRNADKNLRIYHGAQISKGRRSIRRQRYPIQPHDVLLFHGKRYMAKGIQNLGVYVAVDGRTPIPSAKCTILSHSSGWVRCS